MCVCVCVRALPARLNHFLSLYVASIVGLVHLCFRSHTVNLLTNMPADSYEELLTPLDEDADGSPTAGSDAGAGQQTGIGSSRQTEYDDRNVQAIVSLLEFLDKRLDKVCVCVCVCVSPSVCGRGNLCVSTRKGNATNLSPKRKSKGPEDTFWGHR